MDNDLEMEEMFKRFRLYSKPTEHQKTFLELYKNRSSLLDSEIELLNSTFRILKNIDKLHKEKIKLRELSNSVKNDKRKKDAHIKIVVGSALLNAIKSNSPSLTIFRIAFDNLKKEKFIKEDDIKKIEDFLILSR